MRKGDGLLRKAEEKRFSGAQSPVAFITSGLFGLLLCVMLLFLAAFLLEKELLPEQLEAGLPAAAMCIASFVSARMTVKALGRALITSLTQGLCNLALCYVTGAVVFMRIVPTTWDVYTFLACMAGALLGGLISAGMRPRRHKIK